MVRKKAVTDRVSTTALAQSVGEAIVQSVLNGGGTIQDLQSVIDEPGLQHRIAQMVIRTELPTNHYRMHVTYEPMPSLERLRATWGSHVSDVFDGRPFTLHASCAGMSTHPGTRTFYLRRPYRSWTDDELIVWAASQRTKVAPNGYRPAIHTELYEFAVAYPWLVDFACPGSSVIEYGERVVVGVTQYRTVDGRILGTVSFRHPFRPQANYFTGKTAILLVAR